MKLLNRKEKNTIDKPKSLKTNAIFNGLYQILVLLAPLLTTPYISRVFGSEINGDYSYYYSILGYFSLVAAFGFNEYGTKVIAEYRDNNQKKSQAFWEIMAAKGLLSAICLGVYLIITFALFSNDSFAFSILLAMVFYVVSVMLDPTFFFQGDEDFVSISIRNCFIRILTIVLIFVLVKTSDDIVTYALILSLGNLLATLIMYLSFRHKHIIRPDFKSFHLWPHFIKTFPFFVPNLAVTLFTSLNQTLLGAIGNNSAENGYFSQGMKIVTLLSTLAGSLSIIMLSRMSYLFEKGDEKEIEKKTRQTFEAFWSVALPMTFGLCAVNALLIPLFLGDGYEGAINVVYIASPVIILSPLNGLFGSLYYRPRNRIWTQTIIILVSSLVNVACSYLLIPNLLAMGAAIARLAAEAVQLPLLLFFSRNKLKASTIFSPFIIPFDNSFIMFLCIYFLNMGLEKVISNSLLLLAIEILSGVVIYGLLALITKDPFLYNLFCQVKDKIKGRIFKKKEGK